MPALPPRPSSLENIPHGESARAPPAPPPAISVSPSGLTSRTATQPTRSTADNAAQAHPGRPFPSRYRPPCMTAVPVPRRQSLGSSRLDRGLAPPMAVHPPSLSRPAHSPARGIRGVGGEGESSMVQERPLPAGHDCGAGVHRPVPRVSTTCSASRAWWSTSPLRTSTHTTGNVRTRQYRHLSPC